MVLMHASCCFPAESCAVPAVPAVCWLLCTMQSILIVEIGCVARNHTSHCCQLTSAYRCRTQSCNACIAPCWRQALTPLSGCRYEFQMQFGSIGWSVGATLGYAQALKGKKRVLASIGDGSFQVTAQVSCVLCMLCLNLTMQCSTKACCHMIAHSLYDMNFEME